METFMLPYLIAGVCVLITAALTVWLIFAYRAGRNSARVSSERQDASDALKQTRTISAIAQAQADAPQTDDKLFAKMNSGKEGQ